MESLQQATDGDGQRRNAKRYQESNITLRRYIEDEHVQETEPNGWWEALLVIKARSFTALCAAKPETNKGQKISNALRKKKKKLSASVHFYSKEQTPHSVSSGSQARPHGQWRVQTHTVCYPACPNSLSLFCFVSFYSFRMCLLDDYTGFVHSSDLKEIIIKLSLRCRKRSNISTTSTDQLLQHIKLNPCVRTGLDSKLMQHSSFPSKPLVTTC